MESLLEFLNVKVISVGEYDFYMVQFLTVPLILLVSYLLLRWLVARTSSAMTRRSVNADVVQFVHRSVYILGIVIIVITTLDLLNIPVTAFAFVSGAIAIGVGFGAQNIINNFISGWILMWERPIRIGDFIEIGETTGTVEEINTRSTRIRRIDGVHMLVPNSRLLEETVVNWTLVDDLLRCIVRVGVSYGSDAQLCHDVLSDVVEKNPLVRSDPLPMIVFEDFGDNALIFDVYFWVNSSGERSARQIRSDVRFEIDRRFRENDIVIAFPQRDVHLDGSIDIRTVSD